MKIALYRHTLSADCSYETICNESSGRFSTGVRISEWIDVDFPLRNAEEFVPEQLAVLDKAEAELRDKFAKKLQEIAERRAKLRCLTYQPPEASEPDEPSDPDGECFRGGEWAAAQARESEWIQRNLK